LVWEVITLAPARNDPLAGYREEINSGERDHVTWSDDGQGCPVERGEVFHLRSCMVQVVSTKRVQKGRQWLWLARLRVLRADTPQMLTRGLRLTKDPRQALRGQDDHGSTTLQSVEPLDNPANLYAPPEPEVVPHEVVKDLPTTVAARARFEEARQDTIRQNLDRSLASQLREVGVRARNTGVDLGTEYEELEDILARMKQKVARAA
jgi:hypothetical protein